MYKIKYLGLFVFSCFFLVASFATNAQVRDDLLGRILLRVELRGEAYYVNPLDGQRYFLSRPEKAFLALRQFGLGIKSSDLQKIPLAFFSTDKNDSDHDGISDELEKALMTNPFAKDSDGDGFGDFEELKNGYNPLSDDQTKIIDNDFAKRLAGRILLQVENGGRAWYVNPQDNLRYYLGKPQDAFYLMKLLGLGINEDDLSQIPLGILRDDFFGVFSEE